jgi:thiamine biosynthesis lipoprotein
MRGAATALVLLTLASVRADSLILVHGQRYAMGTMFDIVVYHGSRGEAERAIDRALDEIVRLDHVLSHFNPDSNLSRLVRDGGRGFVRVDPHLFAVLEESLEMSRRSGGRFDVTIGPLLRAWNEARDERRRPSSAEISEARRCVGFEKIETRGPDRVRLRSDCVEIDFGGIGKGYAVDRAMQILSASGITRAVVNAGSSSIAASGAPPGRAGWPVTLGADASGGKTIMLEHASISTSRQNGEILDPSTRMPAEHANTVTVVAPTATASDALSTTLVMLPIDDGRKLVAEYAGVSAFWISPDGTLTGVHCGARMELSGHR